MTAIKEISNQNIDEINQYLGTSIIETDIKEKNDMRSRFSYKELEDELSFCFVLGYN